MTSLNVESVPDAVDFCDNLGLMLKPIAKMQIIIKLPKLTIPGQSISNWDLMERMKKAIVPMQLEAIRVRESSLEVVVFEAEALTKSILKQSMKMLDGLSMKVSGFSEPLRIKASEAKLDFPTRHDWDLFYMKNRLDENKPGERPDTIYLSRVPVKWFNDGIVDGPSESLLKKAMSGFGTVRIVDIPICDPLRIHLTPKISGIQCRGFGFGQEVFFEAYVQFEEYKGFMTAMACLRNMKWLKRIEGKLFQADVKSARLQVDFDRTRHLSEAQMERRKAERERLLMDRRKLQDEETRVRLEEEKRLEQLQQEKERRREEREQKRKEKREQERLAAEIEERSRREAEEERKAAKQLRIVQAQRLLENVFSRIQQKEERRVAREKAELHDVANEVKSGDLDLESREQKLREMLLKQRELRMREQMKERLAKSVKSRSRSSSLSSEPERREEKRSRKKKKHHKNEKKHRHHKKRRRSSS